MEKQRLHTYYEQSKPEEDWLLWGPYLSERQWGTVREDYSPDGDAWNYLPHDHARSRAYRWGEDGLMGITDRFCRLCFAVALWNGNDPILKERLFGLTGPEGNHGEDVKELYYYLDNTPTHSYMKALYKYPQAAFPYEELVAENGQRSKIEREYELLDTGVFEENRYFDVEIEYAKADWDDLLIRITVSNRGPEEAPLWLLPTFWYRNRWSFGRGKPKHHIGLVEEGHLLARTKDLGDYHLYFESGERVLFTENETNRKRIFGEQSKHPFVKDAFHRALIGDDFEFLDEKTGGTKCAPVYRWEIPAGGSKEIRLRMAAKPVVEDPLGTGFESQFNQRIHEADQFYRDLIPNTPTPHTLIHRQALAGMLWTKQFYYLDIPEWLAGDPNQAPPPASRKKGRNHEWKYLNNQDILSMPDKWEYPWYAAWDTAFHCVPLALVDPTFAKEQLILMMREWYMAPNGQIPAYEWNFSDVNPPVQAWAALKIYEMEKAQKGEGDLHFLKRIFQKLMLNFTWWVNRKGRQWQQHI